MDTEIKSMYAALEQKSSTFVASTNSIAARKAAEEAKKMQKKPNLAKPRQVVH